MGNVRKAQLTVRLRTNALCASASAVLVSSSNFGSQWLTNTNYLVAPPPIGKGSERVTEDTFPPRAWRLWRGVILWILQLINGTFVCVVPSAACAFFVQPSFIAESVPTAFTMQKEYVTLPHQCIAQAVYTCTHTRIH